MLWIVLIVIYLHTEFQVSIFSRFWDIEGVPKFLKVGSGHLGFMQITGVAKSCQSGNQAEFTGRGHVSTDQQKNFIGKNISRLIIGYI